MKLGTLVLPTILAFVTFSPLRADTPNQASPKQVKVETNTKASYGAYLTDDKGMSLYLFKADESLTSNCYDDCAEAWPPLLSKTTDVKAGDSIDAKKLKTFKRRDGKLQVAYNGWPLYYYIKDKEPGDTKGQDVLGFGAEWYLVSPQGEEVHGE